MQTIKKTITQSDFNNGCNTTPILPDTGAVLAGNTQPVLAQYGADNALSVLAEYCLSVPVSTGLIRAYHYWLTNTGTILNFHDSHYCASNGKSVVAIQYCRSTDFFVFFVTITIGPTGKQTREKSERNFKSRMILINSTRYHKRRGCYAQSH